MYCQKNGETAFAMWQMWSTKCGSDIIMKTQVEPLMTNLNDSESSSGSYSDFD